ncbi:Alpha/Beta hydrolase protein [Aspergillus aurantiobrunneus]
MTDSITFISNSRFHRRLTVDTAHGPLKVSFADIGCSTGPALLYLPGMFASRYLGIPMHVMAERAGVRLLVVDRPGIGGSTDVSLAQRISVWVDMLPRLLARLGILRVSLAAHSAGAIYLLNTWAQCREVISPAVFIIAPWVDAAHSRVTSMRMAQYLPNKVFSFWHHIPRVLVTQASPVFASSGALVRRMSLSSGIGTNQAEEDRTFLDANWRRIERDYAVPRKESAQLFQLSLQFMFAESTVGANSEAMQCLRKGEGSDWGACSDYASCARMLVERERERRQRAQGVMKLRTYLAEKDAMVGSRGQEYMEECWRGLGEGVEVVSRKLEGTDHDTVSQAVEVWEEIFSLIKT